MRFSHKIPLYLFYTMKQKVAKKASQGGSALTATEPVSLPILPVTSSGVSIFAVYTDEEKMIEVFSIAEGWSKDAPSPIIANATEDTYKDQ